jgi:hypothetical protein
VELEALKLQKKHIKEWLELVKEIEALVLMIG